KINFLEHKDGTAFDTEEISEVRKHARTVFQFLLNNSLAPETWSLACVKATNCFRSQMYEFCPSLALCGNHWKVDAVGTEDYSQWSRRHQEL
ncbi:hypothetical protein B0H10DRAFT_1630865, partial [Mycena sp. CBHHK59/15]